MDNDYTRPKSIVTKPKQMLNAVKFKSWMFLSLFSVMIAAAISTVIFIFARLDWYWDVAISSVLLTGSALILYLTLFKPDMLGHSRWDKILYKSVETRDVKVTDIKSTFHIKGDDTVGEDLRSDLEKPLQIDLNGYKGDNYGK